MPDMFASTLSSFLNSASNATGAISKDTDKLDFSLIVIWFVALFAILTGALWTRYEFKISLDTNNRTEKQEEEQEQAQQSEITQINTNNTNESKIANSNDLSLNNSARLFHKSQRTNKKQTNQNNRTNNKQDLDDKNLTTISVGYFAIFILLIFVVSMLLLLYFFYNIMSNKKIYICFLFCLK